MSDETLKPASHVATDEATPEPSADKVEPQTTSDSVETTGVEAKIGGLKAQLGRKDKKIESMQKLIDDMAEANKTEDDKRIEQVAQAKYGNELQRLNKQDELLAAMVDTEIMEIPQEYRGLIDDDAPLVTQLQQVRAASKVVSKITMEGANVGSSANPPPSKGKEQISYDDFEAWRARAATDPNGYYADKERMETAYKEGRVKKRGE